MRSAIPGLLVVALLLGGCATMSESECLTVDWQTIGFEDGVAGYAGDPTEVLHTACNTTQVNCLIAVCLARV